MILRRDHKRGRSSCFPLAEGGSGFPGTFGDRFANIRAGQRHFPAGRGLWPDVRGFLRSRARWSVLCGRGRPVGSMRRRISGRTTGLRMCSGLPVGDGFSGLPGSLSHLFSDIHFPDNGNIDDQFPRRGLRTGFSSLAHAGRRFSSSSRVEVRAAFREFAREDAGRREQDANQSDFQCHKTPLQKMRLLPAQACQHFLRHSAADTRVSVELQKDRAGGGVFEEPGVASSSRLSRQETVTSLMWIFHQT